MISVRAISGVDWELKNTMQDYKEKLLSPDSSSSLERVKHKAASK